MRKGHSHPLPPSPAIWGANWRGGGNPRAGMAPALGFSTHQPHGCCIGTRTPDPSRDGRNNQNNPHERRNPVFLTVACPCQWHGWAMGPAPPSPRRGLGAVWRFPGTERQPGETGRAPRQPTGCCLFTQQPAGRAERAAAKPSQRLLFPTLVAIKKCKFILLLQLLFSPPPQHAKRSSGRTAPRSGRPAERGSCRGRETPPGGQRVARAAPVAPKARRARAARNALESRTGSWLRFPLGSCALRPRRACRRLCPRGEIPKNNPKIHNSAPK